MKPSKTVHVDFVGNTNGIKQVDDSGGFYDRVESVTCYGNAVPVSSWTGSTDSRVTLFDGSNPLFVSASKVDNGGMSLNGESIGFSSGGLSVQFFHNQNAYSLPSVKSCSLTLGTSNWFQEFTYSDSGMSMAYTAMVVAFVTLGAFVGKRMAQGRREKKNASRN